MKKLFALLLCLSLLFVSSASLAEGETPAAAPEWIELSADDTVLTVRIPLEDAKTQSCRFLFPEEGALELLTCEVIGDEEGEEGDDMWVGSFMTTFKKFGHTFLQLGVYDAENNLLSARMVHLFVREDGSVELVSFEENSPFWLTEDQGILNFSLPSNPSTGFSWSYGFSVPDVLLLTSEEYIADPAAEGIVGAGGKWTARFEPAFTSAGFVDLTLRYARSWEDAEPAEEIILNLFVNEAGMIQFVEPRPAE